jgi:hypothetical protein
VLLPLDPTQGDHGAVATPLIRRFTASDFDAATCARAKVRQSTSVSVCIPARNEAATIGPIVETIRRELIEREPLVDEIIVVDDHSTDGTDRIATDAGAEVVAAESVLPDYGEGHGKGEALWKSLYASRGDVVVWCDGDVRDFDPGFVVGLAGPLLTRPISPSSRGSTSGRSTADRQGAAGSPSCWPGRCSACCSRRSRASSSPCRRVRRPS